MPAPAIQGTASPGVPARPLLAVVSGQRSAGDHVWRWRWDLNPRRGCPLTRFRGVRPRPLGDSTAGELTRIGTQPAARITGVLSGLPPAGGEKVAHQGAALLGEDPADDFRA